MDTGWGVVERLLAPDEASRIPMNAPASLLIPLLAIGAVVAEPAPEALLADTEFAAGFGAAFIYGSAYTGGRRPPLGEVTAYRDISPTDIAVGPATPGATIQLKFRAFVDVRPDNGVDRFEVILRSTSGEQQVVHAKSDGPLGSWYPVNVTTAFGQTGQLSLRLRFQSGPGIGAPQSGVGVLVDDLEIKTACGSICTGDDQCETGDPCNPGVCLQGQCTTLPVPNCCVEDFQCPDQGACVEERLRDRHRAR